MIIKGNNSKTRIALQVLILGLCLLLPGLVYAATLSLDTDNAVIDATTVEVVATYVSGEDLVSSINFELAYDDTKLSLSSIGVAEAATVSEKSIEYNETSSSTAKVVVYGLNATTIQDGDLLTFTFSLVDGASGDAVLGLSDSVAASPSAGSISLTVNGGTLSIDTQGPVITLISPTDGAVTGDDQVTVEGTVDDLSVETVLINGESVIVTDGEFSALITLSEGANTIEVSATDAANNMTTESISITCLVGDVNGDGLVNTTDVTQAKEQYLGMAAMTSNADVNNDGIITVIDLQSIINKML